MEIVPSASTREAGSLAVASWEAPPEKTPGTAWRPTGRARDGRSVVARKSPASPANRPLAAKAARVPAAAGTGSLAGREPSGRFVRHGARVGVPVSGTNRRPSRPTAPRARNTR